MATNIVQFNVEIDGFNAAMLAKLVGFHRKVSDRVLTMTVLRTPVDTGHAKGNWQTTINNTTEEELDIEDKNGLATITKGRATLASLKPFQTVFVQNNVDYILGLEQGTGSKQAPEGMVAVTLAELGDFTEL